MAELTLRDYQQQLITDTYTSMQAGNRRPLVVLATGGGKTACFAKMADLAQQKGSVVWFLVHRRELYKQTEETFERFNIPTDNIHIGMVGQVARNSQLFPKPDMIVFDEGHHASAATWQKIVDRFPGVWIIGLTATPARLDGKPLGKTFDDLVLGPQTAELIRRGFLSPYRLYSVPTANTAGLKTKGADFDPESAAELMMQRAVFGDVIKHYRELADGTRAICFCTTIKHSEAMAAEFQAAGINAVHFDGTTGKRDRDRIIDEFRAGTISVLCNVDLISEGFDLPACDAVILLRPTQSLGLYIQQVGRCLRPAPNKTAVILDHVGNAHRHGLPDDPREWSLTDTVKPTAKFTEQGELILRTCLSCYAVYPNNLSECPLCGAAYESTREEIQQIESVRLEEIKRRQESRKQDWNEKRQSEIGTLADCRTYNDLVLYARKTGEPDARKFATRESYRLGIARPWERSRR